MSILNVFSIWNCDIVVLHSIQTHTFLCRLNIDDRKRKITFVSPIIFNSEHRSQYHHNLWYCSVIVGMYIQVFYTSNKTHFIEFNWKKTDFPDVRMTFYCLSTIAIVKTPPATPANAVCAYRGKNVVLHMALTFRLWFKNRWIIEIPSGPSRHRRKRTRVYIVKRGLGDRAGSTEYSDALCHRGGGCRVTKVLWLEKKLSVAHWHRTSWLLLLWPSD